MFENEFKNFLISHGITLEYENAVSFWIRWCKQTGVDILLPDYTDIINFVAYNIQAEVSHGTINNRLQAIRKYYVFMVETGKVPPGVIDEVLKFKNLKTDTKVKNVFDKQEFARIVGNVMDTTRRYRKAEKFRAVLFFMFYTGLRISEVVNLKRQDFDLSKSQVIVRVPVKNKSERYAYFPGGDTGITPYIQKYFKVEPEVINAFNMTEYQIRWLIKQMNKFLPEGRKIHPHTLRHCFGNMLAEGNVNVRVAQKLLGHKNIQSTMVYYDPDHKTVEKIYRDNIEAVKVIKPTKEITDDTKGRTENQCDSSVPDSN